MPVASMKPHGIDRAEVLREKGVLGIASQLVQYDRHYSNVFESLLGGIVVVDTFDNAVAISKKYRYAHRMVTLTGNAFPTTVRWKAAANAAQPQVCFPTKRKLHSTRHVRNNLPPS